MTPEDEVRARLGEVLVTRWASDNGFDPAALRAARRILSLSQQEVASVLGVHANSVSAWETGQKYPHPIHRRHVAAFIAEATRIHERRQETA